MKNLKEIQCSRFNNYSDNNPSLVSVYDFLIGDHSKKQIEEIRNCNDPIKIKELKKKLTAITPSAITSNGHETVIQHTRLLCVDFDQKYNPDVTDWIKFVHDLKYIKYIFYCGLSASGKGAFAIFVILYPEKHLEHFISIEKAFKEIGKNIDGNCSNKNRLRFASFNDNTTSWINEYAKPYPYYTEIKKPTKKINTDYDWKVKSCIKQIIENKIDVTGNYDSWFSVGAAFVNEFGESGRDLFQQISQFYPEYSYDKTDKKYSSILPGRTDGKTIATFFSICSDHGIVYKK